MIDEENENQKNESWSDKYVNIIEDLKENNPDIIKEALSLPFRSRLKRKNKTEKK
jgi:hypothetical protein